LKRGFEFAPGYRLQEFLGRGQFGQVWRATAPGGAAAAVKFIDLSDGQGQKEYDAVRRVKQIRHANLMPITAIWLLDAEGKVIEEVPDEAMETLDLSVAQPRGQSAVLKEIEPSWLVVSMLLGGKSLHQRMRECCQEGLSGIPPRELISYMDESAKGIDFLNAPQHDLGEGPIAIQHSDVKPANIVLIGSSAVVCDFGLARILSRNQVTATSAAGTPAYMAPEAISGKPSRTSDQYSLAVTYYHLRTGKLPVNDGSLWEVLDAHRQGKLTFGLLEQAEQEVLRKATDLNWENRFDTNVEMVDALREALRSEGHTKPSFVPNSAELGPAGVAAVNVSTDDPTATLDVAQLPTNANAGLAGQGEEHQTALQTQPFAQAAIDTEEKFLDQTLPQLKPSSSSSGPLVQTLQQHARLAVGGLGLLFVIAAVVIFWPDPDDLTNNSSVGVNPDSEQLESRQDSNADDVNSQPPVAAGDWLARALAEVDRDEAAAKELFQNAIDADPGLTAMETNELTGHRGAVMFAEISSDGKWLATAAEQPRLWNISEDFSGHALPGHTDLIETLAFNASGQWLVTAGNDGKPIVWNVTEGNVLDSGLVLPGHAGAVLATAWHPSEPILVTSSSDPDNPDLGVWQLGPATANHPHGTILRQGKFGTTATMKTATIDPSGRWLVTISDPIDGLPAALAFRWEDVIDTLEVESSPQPIRITGSGINARKVTFAQDDQQEAVVVVGDAQGSVTRFALADQPQSLPGGRDEVHRSFVESIKVVSDQNGDTIVSGSADGSVSWWKTGAANRQRTESFCVKAFVSVDCTPDGRWVAFGSYDGSVWLWDTQTQKIMALRLSTGCMVHVVRIDPRSRWLVAGCDDGIVRVWDLRWAKLLALTRPSIMEADLNREAPQTEVTTPPLAYQAL
ncbi:MAG: protein kinase, partial [Pirellulales bacterium]|nr:protein kinase [Pirellulales bacterium]